MNADVISDGTRQCANGETPPLRSVDASFFTRQFEDFWQTDPDEGRIGVDLSIWFGIEERSGTDCIWVGQEEAGICRNFCPDSYPEPTIADVRTLAEDFLDEMENKIQEDWDAVVKTIAVAVIVAGIILAIAAFGGAGIGAGKVLGAAAI